MIKAVQAFTVPISLCFLDGQTAFWQQNDIQLHVLTSQKDQLMKFAQQHSVKVQPIAFRRSLFSWWFDMVSFVQLYYYFGKEKPDIVHGNTPKAALLTMLAARLRKIPVRIYEIHGLPLETAGFWGKVGWRIIEKITCACATQVIPVSHSLSQVVIQNRLVDPSKVIVLQQGSCNGVDTAQKFNPDLVDRSEVEAIRKKWGLEAHQPVVGFVGRLTTEKGIEELYKAWQIVKIHCPYARLMLIGSDDERSPLPNNLKHKINMDNSILMVGHVTNIASYYALMDFLVLPSHREGLGNVVLEAAAMKKPAVVSRVTGLLDAVKDHKTGLFCEVGSVEDLAHKIQIYLHNPKLIRAHGQVARECVCEDFAPQNIWIAKLQLYHRLLAPTQSLPLPHVSSYFQVAN